MMKATGGVGWEEENLIGWDIGTRIGSLQALIDTQLDIFIPWMSYIADIEKEGGVCRVYGYLDQHCSFGSLTKGGIRCDWFTEYQLQHMLGKSDYICRVVHSWQRDDIIRGKGKACSQRKHQFD